MKTPQTPASTSRRPWVRPELKPVGTVGTILEGGTGKASVLSADSGDSRKPNGQS